MENKMPLLWKFNCRGLWKIVYHLQYHHDDKLTVDSPMDEVLKDADVIHHCVNDLSKPIKEKEQARFDSLMKEFGMTK